MDFHGPRYESKKKGYWEIRNKQGHVVRYINKKRSIAIDRLYKAKITTKPGYGSTMDYANDKSSYSPHGGPISTKTTEKQRMTDMGYIKRGYEGTPKRKWEWHEPGEWEKKTRDRYNMYGNFALSDHLQNTGEIVWHQGRTYRFGHHKPTSFYIKNRSFTGQRTTPSQVKTIMANAKRPDNITKEFKKLFG
jgi:hypothetical protein